MVKVDGPTGTDSAVLGGRPLEERFRAGEAAALDEMVRLYQEKVTRLVYRLTGWSAMDVEDVVQEVFVAAVKSAKRFDGHSALSTWLTRITINRCRSDQRRRILRMRYWRAWATRQEKKSDSAADEQMTMHERAKRVIEEVRRLPVKYREVMVLRYLEEMEIDEVAGTLGIARAAVEVRLHRARQQLRGTLADAWKERAT